MNASASPMRLALRLLLRDWRSGELVVLMVALVVAVTALTAVGFLTDRIGQAVTMRASASLAADLRLSSPDPISEEYLQLATANDIDTAQMTSMPSVVFVGESNTLAAVRAVTEGYPLRGALKISDRLLEPGVETSAIPGPGEAWAAPNLLARLGADVGDEMELGRTTLRITKVLNFRPDEGWSFVDLAPSLLINDRDLAATALIQPGSRVTYRQLFAGERNDLEAFRGAMEPELGASERLRDIEDTSPQIKMAMDRAGRFLNLASLISVLLSAIAVAMAARRYSHRHRDRVALMKCLGASQSFVNRTNTLQLLVLAVAGGVVGVALGFLGQESLAFLLREFIGDALPWPGTAPIWLGLVTSLCILAGFALPDLVQMGRTPPLRVLRNDVDAPPLSAGIGLLAAIGAVLALLG
ncbi:MAG: FtsX-like permease family protein, partial [Pseudomonadota bacterium]